MKKTLSVAKAVDPAKSFQSITLLAEKENKLSDESDLSPKRIMNGASATSALFNQILAQREKLHQLRNWGIE